MALVPCEFPFEEIKGPCLAIWANESGWGNSILAEDHNNFGGMKWHSSMESFVDEEGNARVKKVDYRAWDGAGEYCGFASWIDFVDGFFHRLDNHPAYNGWRGAAARGGQSFMEFVSPIWFGKNERENYAYLKKIRLLWEARFLAYLQAGPVFYKKER